MNSGARLPDLNTSPGTSNFRTLNKLLKFFVLQFHCLYNRNNHLTHGAIEQIKDHTLHYVTVIAYCYN